MAKIYLNELAAVLAEKQNVERREAQAFVSAVVNVIKQGLEKDRLVKIRGLGTFNVIDVDARESVNVNTGERLVIDGHAKLTFVPDAQMKELVNKPFSLFETVILKDGVDFDDIPSEIVGEKEADEEPTDEVDEETVEEVAEETGEEMVEEMAEKPAEEIVEEMAGKAVEEIAEKIDEKPVEGEMNTLIDFSEETSEEEAPDEEASDEEVPEEETSDEEVTEEETSEEEDEEPRSSSHTGRWLALALFALLVGFGGGFFAGRYTAKPAEPVQPATLAQEQPAAPAQEQPKDTLEAQTDTTTSVETSSDTVGVAASAAQPSAAQPSATVAQDGKPEWERYNDMDVRTRNGYYYIMGLDHVEKARQGDNTKRMARRVFGADEMACYIEVYNGLSAGADLEAGTEVKIPKVETKKSVRKKLQQQNN